MAKNSFYNATCILVIFFLFATTANAQQVSNGGAVGFVYGLSVPDAQGVNPHRITGLMGTAKLNKKINIGGYFLTSAEEDGSNGTKFDYNLTGVEALLNITEQPKNIYVGIRTGITKVSTTQAATDIIFSPYHYGLAAGYNYYVFKHLTFGFDGSFLAFQESRATVGGTDFELKPFQVMTFLATMKIWL